MIYGDTLILTTASCKKRHFIYDGSIKDDKIIAILFDNGISIVPDLAPQAKNVSVQDQYPSVLSAFYDLDEQLSELAA